MSKIPPRAREWEKEVRLWLLLLALSGCKPRVAYWDDNGLQDVRFIRYADGSTGKVEKLSNSYIVTKSCPDRIVPNFKK